MVNNACQTVRRPSSYYAHLLGAERALEAVVAAAPTAGEAAAPALEAGEAGDAADDSSTTTTAAAAGAGTGVHDDIVGLVAQQAARARGRAEGGRAAWLGNGGHGFGEDDGDKGVDGIAAAALPPSPAHLSQLKLNSDDHTHTVTAGVAGALPAGRLDVNGMSLHSSIS
jgi:hypothetical protein